MKTICAICVVCFLFFTFVLVPNEAAAGWSFGGNGSNANVPSGGHAKPFQTKVKLGESTGQWYKDDDSPGIGLDDEPEPKELPKASYIGTWIRTALYLNGALRHQTPATLIYTKDKFTAAGTCSTAGTIEVKGKTIKTVMTSTDCPGGVKAPLKIVYNYEISEDGKKMTLTVGPVREEYVRK